MLTLSVDSPPVSYDCEMGSMSTKAVITTTNTMSCANDAATATRAVSGANERCALPTTRSAERRSGRYLARQDLERKRAPPPLHFGAALQ